MEQTKRQRDFYTDKIVSRRKRRGRKAYHMTEKFLEKEEEEEEEEKEEKEEEKLLE